ncbi:uncharacterized protein LOC118189518 isoform X2 [Stegodyphus dumicola]|nr:uncharacterized protein LOC118189518 isoform X2 [Stegodyphus dumicola]
MTALKKEEESTSNVFKKEETLQPAVPKKEEKETKHQQDEALKKMSANKEKPSILEKKLELATKKKTDLVTAMGSLLQNFKQGTVKDLPLVKIDKVTHQSLPCKTNILKSDASKTMFSSGTIQPSTAVPVSKAECSKGISGNIQLSTAIPVSKAEGYKASSGTIQPFSAVPISKAESSAVHNLASKSGVQKMTGVKVVRKKMNPSLVDKVPDRKKSENINPVKHKTSNAYNKNKTAEETKKISSNNKSTEEIKKVSNNSKNTEETKKVSSNCKFKSPQECKNNFGDNKCKVEEDSRKIAYESKCLNTNRIDNPSAKFSKAIKDEYKIPKCSPEKKLLNSDKKQLPPISAISKTVPQVHEGLQPKFVKKSTKAKRHSDSLFEKEEVYKKSRNNEESIIKLEKPSVLHKASDFSKQSFDQSSENAENLTPKDEDLRLYYPQFQKRSSRGKVMKRMNKICDSKDVCDDQSATPAKKLKSSSNIKSECEMQDEPVLFGTKDQDQRRLPIDFGDSNAKGWAQYKAAHPDEYKSPGSVRDSLEERLKQRRFSSSESGDGFFSPMRPRLQRGRNSSGFGSRRGHFVRSRERFPSSHVGSVMLDPQIILQQAEDKYRNGVISKYEYLDLCHHLQKVLECSQQNLYSDLISQTQNLNSSKMKNHEFSNPQKLRANLEHEINFQPQTMKFKNTLPLPSAVKPFKLDNKMRLVHFVNNKALVVLDNNEPRELTFEGEPREVYVEGLAEPIILGFDGKPVEFEVNGKRHSMKFGTPAREIYINDYPYEAKFGGPPFEARLDDGQIYNIRLSGPPPQVVVGDKPEYELFAKTQGGNNPLHKKSEFSDSKMETKYQFSESSTGSVLQDVDMRIKPENMKMLQDNIPSDNDMKDVDWRKIPPLNEAANTMSQPKIWSDHASGNYENWNEDKTDLSDVKRNLNKREIGQVSVDHLDRQQMEFDDVSSVHGWKEPPSYSDVKLSENLHNTKPHHKWENNQPYEQSDKVNWAHKDYRDSRFLGNHHPKADDTDHLEHVSSVQHTEHNCSSDIQHTEHSSAHHPIDSSSTPYHEHAPAVHHLEHSSTAFQAKRGSDSHHSKHGGFVHTECVPPVYHSENKPLYRHEPSTYHPEREPPVLHSKGEHPSHHERVPPLYHPEPRLAVDHSECSSVKHHVEHGHTIHHSECGALLPHLEPGSGIHHSEHSITRHNLEHSSTMHQSEHGPALHYMQHHPAHHHPEQAPAIHHAKHAVATHPLEQVPAMHNSEYVPTMSHTQGPAAHCLEQEAAMHHLENNPPIHQPEQGPPIHHPEQGPPIHHPEHGSIHISQGNNPEHLESNLYDYDSRHIHQRMSCPPRPPFFNHRVRLRLRGVRYGAWIHPNFRERSHDLFIGSSRRPLLRDPQPHRYIRPPCPLLPLPRFHAPDSVSRGALLPLPNITKNVPMEFPSEPNIASTSSLPSISTEGDVNFASGECDLPVDVESLLEKLVAAGIITSKPYEESSNEPKSIAESETKEEKENDVAEEESVPDIELKSESLRVYYPSVIALLYKGSQCCTCGLRFKELQSDQYSRHLDWHFRMNRREKEGAKNAFARRWFYEVEDWIQFEEFEDFEERVPSYFELQADEPQMEAAVTPVVPSVPAAENITETCQVCGETFDLFWVEDEEEWHLRDAVRHDEQVYHPACYEDFKKASEAEKQELEISVDENLEKEILELLNCMFCKVSDSYVKEESESETHLLETNDFAEKPSHGEKPEIDDDILEGKPGEEEIIGLISEPDMEIETDLPKSEPEMIVMRSGGITLKVKAESLKSSSTRPSSSTKDTTSRDNISESEDGDDDDDDFRPPTPDPKFHVMPRVRKGRELSGLCCIQ